MMKRIGVIVFSLSIVMTLILLIVSLNQKKVDERNTFYTLQRDYSYIYESDRSFEVTVLSTTNDDTLFYLEKNVFGLCDYTEDFYYSLCVVSLSEKKENDLYEFEFKFKLPCLSNYYLSRAYLKISNEKYSYKGSIGSFYISDDYKMHENLSYESLGGNFINNTLANIKINYNGEYNVTDILTSDNIQLTYKKDTGIFDVFLQSQYYLNNTFLVIKTDKNYYVIDNYYYGVNTISLVEYYQYLAPFVRVSNDKL